MHDISIFEIQEIILKVYSFEKKYFIIQSRKKNLIPKSINWFFKCLYFYSKNRPVLFLRCLSKAITFDFNNTYFLEVQDFFACNHKKEKIKSKKNPKVSKKVESKYLNILYHLAILCFEINFFKDTIKILKCYTQSIKTSQLAYTYLAKSKFHMKDYEDCIKICEKSLFKLNPSQKIYKLLIDSNFKIDNLSTNLRWIEKAQKSFPNNEKFKLMYAEYLIRTKKILQAQLYLKKIESSLIQKQKVIEYFGVCFMKLKKTRFAKNLFLRALSLEKSNTEVIFKLAKLYSFSGQKILAIEQFENFIIYEPFNKYAIHELGKLLIQVNQFERAEECFRKVTDLDPNFEKSYPFLIKIYKTQNKKEKVMEIFEKLITFSECKLSWFLSRESFKKLLKSQNISNELRFKSKKESVEGKFFEQFVNVCNQNRKFSSILNKLKRLKFEFNSTKMQDFVIKVIIEEVSYECIELYYSEEKDIEILSKLQLLNDNVDKYLGITKMYVNNFEMKEGIIRLFLF